MNNYLPVYSNFDKSPILWLNNLSQNLVLFISSHIWVEYSASEFISSCRDGPPIHQYLLSILPSWFVSALRIKQFSNCSFLYSDSNSGQLYADVVSVHALCSFHLPCGCVAKWMMYSFTLFTCSVMGHGLEGIFSGCFR